MKALEQLEILATELLKRMDALKTENAHLHELVSALARDKETLKEQNGSLNAALEKETGLRLKALERIDALLNKIREHAKIVAEE